MPGFSLLQQFEALAPKIGTRLRNSRGISSGPAKRLDKTDADWVSDNEEYDGNGVGRAAGGECRLK